MGISSILLTLSGFLLKEWDALSNVVTKLFFFVRSKNQGLYEILDYETTLELSSSGKTASFLKRQKVRFLQDNIISFQDHAWGQGDIFADYRCSPGIVADRYFVGDRWNILISLREIKSRGDQEEFFIQATFKNAYLNSQEWQQVEIRHQTKHLKMTVVFPKKRHCQRAIVQHRNRRRTIDLDSDQFKLLPDGRQIVKWETKNVNSLEVYTLQWEW